MKPVAIFRHAPSEGPGYFATFLDRHGIPWQLFRIDAGDAVPADPHRFSGLAFMGGPMSVNDDLPWIPHTLDLIRLAASAGIPLLGHCLGGQLMARALGGTVIRNPVKEIGWGEVMVAADAVAHAWFGDATQFTVFHWHGETFTLPPGATCILSSPHCRNQAFVLGKNLALQCHVEMTEEMVKEWYTLGADEVAAALGSSPAVQDAEAASANLEQRVARLHAVADWLYGHWIEALPK